MSVARLVRIGTPYNAVELPDIDYEQTANTLYIAHLDHPPTKMVRQSNTAWTFGGITFGPTIAPPTNLTGLAFSPNTTQFYNRNATYVVVSVNDDTGQISRASGSVLIQNDLTLRGNANQIKWDAAIGATRYLIYKQTNESSSYGYIGQSQQPQFLDEAIGPDYTNTPPSGTNPFSAAGDYPSTVALHQDRLTFARTRNHPNGLYFSQTSDYENFDVARPTKADDAITYAIAGKIVNPVNQLASLPSALVAFTGTSLFTITGAQGASDPVTPLSINARPDVSRGASRLRPITIDNVAFYTTQQGGYVRTLGYSFELDGNKSDNVSIFSPHLFEGFSIASWTYAEYPQSCIWMVRSDGKLLCFTWVQEQQVWGFSICETDGLVESITSIPEGEENRVYLTVWRTVGGVQTRFIERMASALEMPVDQTCYLDCAISFSFDDPTDLVTGMFHLEGRTVTALIDGSVEPDLVVSNGTVQLPYQGSTITIGLPYDAHIETLPLIFQSQGVNAGKRQMNARTTVQVLNTRGIKVGPAFDKLREPSTRSREPLGSANAPVNDYIQGDIQPSWGDEMKAVVSMPYPLPATILGVFVEPVVSSD